MSKKHLVFTSVIVLSMVLTIGQAFAVKPVSNEVPEVTAFDVADASSSPVPILTFTATDSDGTVTGYLVTESSSAPSPSDPGWSATTPTTYATASVGLVTLYGWAMDDKDAVSNSMSDTVDIPDPRDQIIADLQAAVADLQNRLALVEGNSVLDLDGYVRMEPDETEFLAGPHVVFEGVNVHVQNGQGDRRANGRGNLIVGYNSSRSTFTSADRIGSHLVVIGQKHRYMSTEGLVSGWSNTLGADANDAVLLGDSNTISGSGNSSILGGFKNFIGAGGWSRVIVGGNQNSIDADGSDSVVVGGSFNAASANSSTVVGGAYNAATAPNSTVSGGNLRTADAEFEWCAGSLCEPN